MNPTTRAQDLARQLHEDEEAWARFEQKRVLRAVENRVTGMTDEELDAMAWAEVERELEATRAVRVIGFGAA